MKHVNVSSEITIRDPRATAVFVQSHLRRILLQFAHQPRGVAEVANELQIDIRQLHQMVGKFHRLGLLVITEERKRAGRAIRLYQAAANRFFIPVAATPASFSRGLERELRLALDMDTAAGVEGMWFALDADGRVVGEVVKKTGATFVPLDSWRILRLSLERAAQLKQEMLNVLDRFQGDSEPGGQVFLAHAGMARRREHRGVTDNPKPETSVVSHK
jgi:hypothetical protein